MAMNPQMQGDLLKFTNAAKAVIYDAGRLKQLIPLLDSKDGAIQAVHAVMSVIEQKKPIPPSIAPLLGVNAYMLMVDMAHNITGLSPDPEIIKAVVGEIVTTVQQSHAEQGESPQQEQAEPPQQEMQEQQAGTEMPIGQGLVGRQMGV